MSMASNQSWQHYRFETFANQANKVFSNFVPTLFKIRDWFGWNENANTIKCFPQNTNKFNKLFKQSYIICNLTSIKPMTINK